MYIHVHNGHTVIVHVHVDIHVIHRPCIMHMIWYMYMYSTCAVNHVHVHVLLCSTVCSYLLSNYLSSSPPPLSLASDVWSLGVILFMLICGHSPFVSGGASETLTHIMDGRYEIPAHVSESCRE